MLSLAGEEDDVVEVELVDDGGELILKAGTWCILAINKRTHRIVRRPCFPDYLGFEVRGGKVVIE